MPRQPNPGLTPREIEVFECLRTGRNAWEVGRAVGLTRNGVYQIYTRVKRKLGADTTTQALAIAVERKLLG
jgi:DNA-binding CsgD family transcriptional regulator